MRCRHFTLLELAAVIAILILLAAVSGVYIGRERKGAEFQRALQDFQVFCAQARSESMHDGMVRKVMFYPEEKVFRIEKVAAWGMGSAVMLAEDLEGDGEKPYVVLDAIDPDLEEELKSYKLDDEEEEEESSRDNESDGEEEKAPEWSFPEKLDVQFELPEEEVDEEEEMMNNDLSKLMKDSLEEDDSEAIELWRYGRGGDARMTHELTLQMKGRVLKLTVSDFTGLLELVEPSDEEDEESEDGEE